MNGMRFTEMVAFLAVAIAVLSLLAVLSGNRFPSPLTLVVVLTVWLIIVVWRR